MEVSNASLYDGASALAESILMAVRSARKKTKRILMPNTVSPRYRSVVKTLTHHQDIDIKVIDFDTSSGTINPE